MTDELCAAYTSAFVHHLRADGTTVASALIGRDLRPSSPRIAMACMAAIRQAGMDVVDCGVLPTPALALEAAFRGWPAIMVTGSHIPFDRNGIKFYRADGEITKVDEAGILAALRRQADNTGPAGTCATDTTARSRYLQRAQAFPAKTLHGRRIGVYEHSAAGRDLLQEALALLGATVVPLGRTGHFVPIDTEAVGEEERQLARAWVSEYALDALVTTDGDGDRPLLADEAGTFLRGDVLGVLTARFLGADGVATPVSSNTVLERSGWFPRIMRSRIGSPYVIEAMTALAQSGCTLPVGFEANGGFLLGGSVRLPGGQVLAPLPTRDALLPLLSVLAMSIRSGVRLSALVATLPARATASDRIGDIPASVSGPFLIALRDDPSMRTRLLRTVAASEVATIDLTDGVRLTLRNEEIVHFRASGNAPELRCYVEATTSQRAETIVSALLDAVVQIMGR
jgi:phosphomannomutase